MGHLKNKALLFSLLAVLMLLLVWVEVGQFQFTMLLFVLTMGAGYAFTLPVIKNRFDDVFAQQVSWITPAVAGFWLSLSFWLTDETSAPVMSALLLSWLSGLLLFTQLKLKKTGLCVALPLLSFFIILLLEPREQLGLSSPLLFAFVVVLIASYFIAAIKYFLAAELSPKKKKNDPLPASLAKQIKKAEDAAYESKVLKEQIKKLKVDLSAAEMAKMEFLATMSHEIRTPLNGIVPLIDIVMDTELNAFQKDYLTTAHTSATQMQKLIDDLLDYSKVEAGKLTTEITGLKIRKVVEEVIDSLGSSAERKGLDVSVNLDDQISPLLRGDPIRIRQVLTNILSNAIKFSDHGKIVVDVKKVKNFSSKELIRFSIKDQGIGISPDQTEKLFNAFTQADNSSTRKFGGTGLGLAISKKIVELLKGQMGVESKKGVGSTFWFEIPLGKSAGDAMHGGTEIHQHQAILLNTSPILFKRIQAGLEKAALPVQTSLNYQHALSRVQAARGIQDGKTSLLFVDFDTNAKVFRQMLLLVEKGELDDVWICALTTGGHIAGVKQFKNIQVIHPDKDIELVIGEFERRYFPEEVMELDEEQEEAQGSFGSDGAEEADGEIDEEQAQTAGETNSSKSTADISDTILLVEDNEVNLKVAQKLIDYIGFPFDVAENGMVALNKAKKTRYRLILMDCQMPVMDGYFCTRRIRKYEENNKLNHTPIIAMTANAMLGDKEKCLEAGMDDYMSKPLNRYILEKTLKKWDPLAAQKKTNELTKLTSTQAKTTDTDINAKWLNVKSLAEIQSFMGDETNSLLDLFQQESPNMLNKLNTFAQTQDYSEARSIAHTLKSTGANIGASGFSHYCKQVEAAAIEKNTQAVLKNIKNARKAYVLTVKEIKKFQEHQTST
ncbi:ATP-binding protein [Marinicella sp. S1101]|uniref:hybrid sensor histidine kinase/response regulator n=1 Tax=Marinicella marina TaxID=2996016 RepID=UPI002260EBA8|nr:hybrid sensor histidine kinase/response regulator [Marinicella marina]MCX7553228.1 ATP-binding protein [Marinicella marina]MDJ1138960.1 ATP-binding protein [Marinicella marina]